MKQKTIELSVGIFVFIGLICVGYLTIKLGRIDFLQENHYYLTAQFNSVSGLKKGTMVEIAGVKVGEVENISINSEDYMAVVKLKIDKSIKISDDTIASVRTSGLIGDKYIKLSPGGSEEILSPNARIIETESALDIEELLGKYMFGDANKSEEEPF